MVGRDRVDRVSQRIFRFEGCVFFSLGLQLSQNRRVRCSVFAPPIEPDVAPVVVGIVVTREQALIGTKRLGYIWLRTGHCFATLILDINPVLCTIDNWLRSQRLYFFYALKAGVSSSDQDSVSLVILH